ncbi:MAG: hypothetical protein K2X91_13935 [Thermoleophilia bacterium]|nr:hypothetical protein [Thermoleophilia bacterium]
MSPVELADFTSYDLGRLHTALAEVVAERGRDVYGTHQLWGRAQDLLPWDQRYRRCWDDPTFGPRYQWLRARLLPETAGHDYPLGSIVDAHAELVAEQVALDPRDDEEPF